jgi:hypothetical protein
MNNQKTNPTERPQLASLSLIVALWTAGIIVIAMTAYAIWQYYTHPGISVGELIQNHLWHVLVLGAVIYASLWACFRRLLVQPLNRIYIHLYAVGKGQLEPLEIESNIREIQTIVEGINLMTGRMGRAADPKSLSLAQEDVRIIIEQVHSLSAEQPDAFSAITDRLVDLEKIILDLAQVEPSRPASTPN